MTLHRAPKQPSTSLASGATSRLRAAELKQRSELRLLKAYQTNSFSIR